MLRKVLLSTVAATAMIGAASAADLPSRRAPPVAYAPPIPIFTWTGFYIGVNAGAAFRANNNNGNNFFPGVTPLFGFNNNNNSNNARFIGGGQIGYNWQVNQFVFGIETDIQGLTRSNNNNVFGFNNGSINYLGTVRGRLGIAFDRFMIYGTGGFAYGGGSNNNNGFFANVNGAPVFFTGNNTGNNTRIGYAVGAGVEYAFTNNWTVKVEYLYTDLGRRNNGFNNFATGAAFGFDTRERNHIVRAGLNYKFDWFGAPGPVVARY